MTPGAAFGPRYRILQVLGAGGMGVVYKAWDDALGVAVALKVIRPEVMADPAAAQDVERRFKRELLLARQVTHRNVVRIHDLGEVEGIKYITMPYIDGSSLASVLAEKGKLTVAEVLPIAKDIAAGLIAAHEAGVVHRDLKPENIMLQSDGPAVIMDFGISRSAAPEPARQGKGAASPSKRTATFDAAVFAGGLTIAGTVVGTLDYMAPEQARAEPVDQRADIYSFGMIVRDMLLGLRRTTGTNAVAELMARIKQAPPPVRTIDETIPEPVDRIVSRCLEPDPEARFQTTHDLLAELNRLDEAGELLPEPRRFTRRHAIAAVILLTSIVTGTWWLSRTPPPEVQPPPMSVLIADFDNQTGDPVFEGSLEQALSIGVEGASFITAYPRQTAQSVADRLQPGSRLDESMARLVSGREGIKIILAGMIARDGSAYRITVRALDPALDPGEGKPLAVASAKASSKAEVLPTVGSLASEIRGELGDATPESEKRAAIETFTAGSLEAAREYAVAQDLASAGRDEEAVTHYRSAMEKDPKFARAYAALSVSTAKLGRKEESDEAFKQAFSLMDRMTDREKYRTLGNYYVIVARNYEKAVENYSTLVQLYPSDRAGHSNLALAYFYLLNFPKALEEGRRAVEIYPKIETFRNNSALYAMYASDFQTAVKEARQVIQQNPKFAKAYLPLAIGALASGDVPAARGAYEQMSGTGSFGASIAAMGLADIAMYQGAFSDAETILKAGIAEDEQTKNTAGLAAKTVALAEVLAAEGKTRPALDAVKRALEIAKDETVMVPAARVLTRFGRQAEARPLASALDSQLQPQRRAYAKIIEGELALKQGNPAEAVEAFRSAQKLADVWLGRFGLGVAYVSAGHYPEGLAELELAQKRRGEATAIFLDDIPSFRYLAPLPYWLARAQEALGMKPAAAQNYNAYIALREKARNDALVTDAKRRVAGL